MGFLTQCSLSSKDQRVAPDRSVIACGARPGSSHRVEGNINTA